MFSRAFWILAFFCSLTGCICVILKTYDKWQATPVIVSYSEKYTKIWEIPFPAITICPENSYSLIDPDYLWKLNDSAKSSLEPFTAKVQKNVSNRFLCCIWHNERIPCENIFSEIKTDAGFCHSFNMLNFNDLLENYVWVLCESFSPEVMQPFLCSQNERKLHESQQ